MSQENITHSFLRLLRIPFFVFFLFLFPLFAHAEEIELFRSDIEVHADGSFTVTETITYEFTEPRHGITRDIPTTHGEKASGPFQERYTEIVPVSTILMDSVSVPSEVTQSADGIHFKIGDPEKLISGTHVYTIAYDVFGGLSYPKGKGTELYFNITGNAWQVPMRTVEAVVHAPEGILLGTRSCYRGVEGNIGSCAQKKNPDGSVTYTALELMPGEGMTIAEALTVTKVAHMTRERTNWKIVLIPITLIMLLYGAFRLYRFKTAWRTGNPIIPQYEPYPGVKPMYTGLLMDGRLDPRDITACIVYLAEQGYVKIRKTERKVLFLFEVDDYEMLLTKLPDEGVGEFEKRILEIFFNAPLTVGSRIALSELKNNKGEQRENYAQLTELKEILRKDLIRADFFQDGTQSPAYYIGGILVLLVLIGLLGGRMAWYIPFFFGITAIMFLVLFARRRSSKGYKVLDHLEGFKWFLETTERDRYVFHNAPEKNPEQFMEFLPYAIAFGVEEEWAEVFKDITIPMPEWYEGGGVSSFSSASLTQSLGALSNAFTASSGASPSAGGGHSGGGSGGGGGGSW